MCVSDVGLLHIHSCCLQRLPLTNNKNSGNINRNTPPVNYELVLKRQTVFPLRW